MFFSVDYIYYSLPNLLINRLVLNLHLYNEAPDAPSTRHLPEPAFAQNRVLGNIGAPLDHSQWDSLFDDVDEEEEVVQEEDIEAGARNELDTMVPVVSMHITGCIVITLILVCLGLCRGE